MTEKTITEDHDFWRQRWADGQTGWHRGDTNPALLRFGRRMTGEGSARVLVPLCGKTLDMAHLASQGHDVVGVELVERGARAFFSERAWTAEEQRFARGTRLAAGRVTILVADIFQLTAADVGAVDCVYDRGALIALAPAVRERYVQHLLGFLRPGARILLLTLTYDQTRVDGPPYAVAEDEVRAHFEPSCDVECLEVREEDDGPPRFKEAKVGRLEQTTWLVTKR